MTSNIIEFSKSYIFSNMPIKFAKQTIPQHSFEFQFRTQYKFFWKYFEWLNSFPIYFLRVKFYIFEWRQRKIFWCSLFGYDEGDKFCVFLEGCNFEDILLNLTYFLVCDLKHMAFVLEVKDCKDVNMQIEVCSFRLVLLLSLVLTFYTYRKHIAVLNPRPFIYYPNPRYFLFPLWIPYKKGFKPGAETTSRFQCQIWSRNSWWLKFISINKISISETMQKQLNTKMAQAQNNFQPQTKFSSINCANLSKNIDFNNIKLRKEKKFINKIQTLLMMIIQ